MKFDLAGVRPGDVELLVEQNRVTVRGVRRDWHVREGQIAHSMEISYNRFERSVELPVDVAACRVESEYQDGMFLVMIRTGEEASR